MTCSFRSPVALGFAALLLFPALQAHARQVTIEGALELGWEARRATDNPVGVLPAGVAVAAGRVFGVGLPESTDGQVLLRASSIQTGEDLWTTQFNFDSSPTNAINAVVATSETVIIAGSVVTTNGIVTTGTLGLINGFDAETGESLWGSLIGGGPYVDLKLAPDGSSAFSIRDRTPFLGGVPNPSPVRRLTTSNGFVQWAVSLTDINEPDRLFVSPDGQTVSVIGRRQGVGVGGAAIYDAFVECLDADDGSSLWSTEVQGDVGDGPRLQDLAFSPDSSTLVAVGDLSGAAAVLFDSATGTPLWEIASMPVPPTVVGVDLAGRVTVAGANGPQASISQYALATGARLWAEVSVPSGPALSLQLDEAGQQAVLLYRSRTAPDDQDWRVEARSLDQGALLSSTTVGAGDGLGDTAVGLAENPDSSEFWVVSQSENSAGLNTLARTQFSLSPVQELSTLSFVAPGAKEDLVRDAGLSPDGARVYTAGRVSGTTGMQAPQGGWLTAHDAATGEGIWDLEFPGSFPCDEIESDIDPDRIFVGGRNPEDLAEVMALDAKTGDVLWSLPFEFPFAVLGSVLGIERSLGSGQIVVAHQEDSFGVQREHRVSGVDSVSGQELWSYGLQSSSFYSASIADKLLITPDGGTAFLAKERPDGARVEAVNTSDGSFIWGESFMDESPQGLGGRVEDVEIGRDGARGYLFGRLGNAFSPSAAFTLCFDALTGQTLWTSQSPMTDVFSYDPVQVRTSRDGAVVYTMTELGEQSPSDDTDLRFEARSSLDGELLWKQDVPANGSFPYFDTTLDGALLVYATSTSDSEREALVGALFAATGDPVATMTTPGLSFDRARTLVFAPDGRRMIVGSRVAFDAGEAGDLLIQEVELPRLIAGPPSISLSAGGIQQFALAAGVEGAGQFSLLLGTTAGVAPGVTLLPGLVLPLKPSGYTMFTFKNVNQRPLADNFSILDAAGAGEAAFVATPGTYLGLVGRTLHHAWVSLDLAGTPTAVSNPVELLLLP